ncbi:unnamed protein product [Heterobilharzia americana]|nr:unnamed protein product [Heterobilharzia americana]
MSLSHTMKKDLWCFFLIFIIYVIYGFKCALCEIVSNSSSSGKIVDRQIMWISIGFGVLIAILIIIICCLLVLVCNLRSTNVDSESDTFEKPVVNRNNCFVGDRVLATSAQRYHFTHQKQQMLAESKFSDVLERGNSPPKMLYPDLKTGK